MKHMPQPFAFPLGVLAGSRRVVTRWSRTGAAAWVALCTAACDRPAAPTASAGEPPPPTSLAATPAPAAEVPSASPEPEPAAAPAPPPPPAARPVLTEPREAKMFCMWFMEDTRQQGASPVVIRVSPNPSGESPVVLEDEAVGGTGAMWRTAAWMASFCASQMTGHLLHEHEFRIRLEGPLDGPSAGMLLTGTMIALLQGDDLEPGVTMTGTINPDGSIGPVERVTHKLAAAKKAGLKKFGYPVGTRLSKDADTGETVDVQDAATALQIEAVEIRDIYDAYQLLTGKSLERPMPAASEAKLDIPIALAQRVRTAAARLRDQARQRLDALKQEINQLPEAQRAGVLRSLGQSEPLIAQSENAEREGCFSQAFRQAKMADGGARLDTTLWEMVNPKFHTKDDTATMEHYAQVAAKLEEETLKRLEAVRTGMKTVADRTTLGGRVDAMHSFANYWQAMTLFRAGKNSHQEFRKLGDQLAALDTPAARANRQRSAEAKQEWDRLWQDYQTQRVRLAFWFSGAQNEAESAEYWSDFTVESGIPVPARNDLYEHLGRAYSSAAGAGIAWFKAVVVEPRLANAALAAPGEASDKLIEQDREYAPVQSAAAYAETARLFGKDEPLLPLDQLASGIYAYHGSAKLFNKYANFRATGGEGTNQPLQLNNRKPLGATLDLARQRALAESSRLAASIGFIPDSVKLNYELANILRDGSDEDRLNALVAYWQCHFLCDLARRLSAFPTKR